MNTTQFRLDFPEFTDVVRFPNSMLVFWATIGEAQISLDRFGDLYTQAVELFTAHNIVLAAGNVEASTAGGFAGGINGAVASKAVGSVSVSYDNASSMLLNAGHWNQTTYGRQYILLARLLGTSCYQL
jgi:hypothetical protein